MNWALIFTFLIFYLPPIYLGWRYFYKRGIYKWAWWTWIASLFGPFAYIVFAIGYRMTYRYRENCPKCGIETPAAEKSMVNEQGDTLKEPILAWASLVAGGIFTAIGLIMVLFWIFGDMSGMGSAMGAALVMGTSGLSWGSTQIQKFNTGKENHVTTYSFKCSGCGHTWEKKTLLTAPKSTE